MSEEVKASSSPAPDSADTPEEKSADAGAGSDTASTPSGTSGGHKPTPAADAESLQDPKVPPLVVVGITVVVIGLGVMLAMMMMADRLPPTGKLTDAFVAQLKADPAIPEAGFSRDAYDTVAFSCGEDRYTVKLLDATIDPDDADAPGHLVVQVSRNGADPQTRLVRGRADGNDWAIVKRDIQGPPAEAWWHPLPGQVDPLERQMALIQSLFDALGGDGDLSGFSATGDRIATFSVDGATHTLTVERAEIAGDGPTLKGKLVVAVAPEGGSPAHHMVRADPGTSATEWMIATGSGSGLAKYLQPVNPRVKLVTNFGTMELELWEDAAPNSTANFISLTEEGFYDDLRFHRIIKGFMIQAGCPTTRGVPATQARNPGTGSPGYRFPDEYTPGRTFDRPGLLAMANSGPNTNGSQFFITCEAAAHLNDNRQRGTHYNMFGELVSGMSVMRRIEQVPVRRQGQGALPLEDVVIQDAELLWKRPHEYQVRGARPE